MALLSNCCGCGSLKTGTLLIGSLNLVISILGILISTWCVTHSKAVAELLLEQIDPDLKEQIHETYYDAEKEQHNELVQAVSSQASEIYTIGMIVLICSLLHVAFSACLVHGTRMRNVRFMMPWIVMMRISLFLNISHLLFGIARNPDITNFIASTIGWALSLYFYLVVCAFKAELEKEGEPGKEVLPEHVDPAAPASTPSTGFLDLPSLKREWKMKNGSDNIKYQPFK